MNRMGTTKRNQYIGSTLLNKERTHVFNSTLLSLIPPCPISLRHQALRLKSNQTVPAKSPIFGSSTESLKFLKMCEQPDNVISDKNTKFSGNFVNLPEKIDDVTHLKPRSYQLEMFEESQKQNVIVAVCCFQSKNFVHK